MGVQELPKWEDPRISNDYSFVPVEEIPRDVDLPNFATLVTSDYIFKAYELYMSGSDSFKGADDDLANIIGEPRLLPHLDCCLVHD